MQFFKGTWKTGESQFFKRFDDLVTLRQMGEGFTWDTQDRQRDIAAKKIKHPFDAGTKAMRGFDW